MPFTKTHNLDVRCTSDGVIILGVPLGSPSFVSSSIREKMNAVDASLELAAVTPDSRVAQNIHRATSSACRLTHNIILIPSKDAMTQ